MRATRLAALVGGVSGTGAVEGVTASPVEVALEGPVPGAGSGKINVKVEVEVAGARGKHRKGRGVGIT